MYLTENEIMNQHEALEKTYAYMMSQREAIERIFKENPTKKFNIMGCGSSYMLAKSGQRMLASCAHTAANSLAGGDFLTNSQYYQKMMEDSIVIALSRSGKTSEILRAIQIIKKETNSKVVSFTMQDDNDFMPYSDLDITMDWCYDQSVCQTRTVTNLYLALAMFSAFYSGDEAMLESLKAAVEQNKEYKEIYRPILKKIASMDWERAVVLADGPLIGIAEEGALAFAEIAMMPGSCFNLLDYRHGPMVLNDEKTLTIMLIPPKSGQIQKDMVEDVKGHHGKVITVSDQEGNPYGADAHVHIENIEKYIAWGIPFINVMQLVAYEKALIRGTNPDEPIGLDAYITL